MRQKVLKGGWPHRPPVGYTVVRSADGKDSGIEIDPRSGPLVREAFELYATGRWGVRALSDHLFGQGLRSKTGNPVPHSYVRKILCNPFYSGVVRWNGKQYPGRHPVLVPNDLFDRVQATVRRRVGNGKPRITGTAFPLKLVAVCALCRGSMTAERHDSWSYYRCCRRMHNRRSCQARFCNAKVAHADVEAICHELRLVPPLRDAIERAALKLIQDRAATRVDAAVRLKRQRARLVQQEMELTQSFVEGRIKADTFEQLGAELRMEIDAVKAKLEESNVDTDGRLRQSITQVLHDAEAVWGLFKILDAARQAALLSAVFEVIVLGPKGVAGYSLRQPFAALFEVAPQAHDVETDTVRRLAEQIIQTATTSPATSTSDPSVNVSLGAKSEVASRRAPELAA